MINLSEQELDLVKNILGRYIRKEQEAYIYGSRVKNTNTKYSDIDIMLIGKRLPDVEMLMLKEAFSESNLPYRVDVQNKANVENKFFQLIEPSLVKIQL